MFCSCHLFPVPINKVSLTTNYEYFQDMFQFIIVRSLIRARTAVLRFHPINIKRSEWHV